MTSPLLFLHTLRVILALWKWESAPRPPALPPNNTPLLSATRSHQIFLHQIQAFLSLKCLSLSGKHARSHAPMSCSSWHTWTHMWSPSEPLSPAVLSPVRADTGKEGHLSTALPSLSHFDGHHTAQFNPTLLTAQWCEQEPWRFVTFWNHGSVSPNVIVLPCSARLIA